MVTYTRAEILKTKRALAERLRRAASRDRGEVHTIFLSPADIAEAMDAGAAALEREAREGRTVGYEEAAES